MNKLSIRGKLFTGFGCIILFLVFISAISYWLLLQMRITMKSFYDAEFMDVTEIHQIMARQNMMVLNLTNMLESSGTQRDIFYENFKSLAQKNTEMLEKLSTRNQNNTLQMSIVKPYFAERNHVIERVHTELVPLVWAGKKHESYKVFLNILNEADSKLDPLANNLISIVDQHAKAQLLKATQYSKNLTNILVVTSLFAIVLSVGMAFWIMNNLRRVSNKINEGVNVLVASGSKINASTVQVASGSAQTATAVQETTSTIEAVKQTSEMSVKKAQQVMELAKKTAKISESGKKSMAESIEAMHHIQEQVESIAQSILQLSAQSQDIGEIIATVNELAEQSNLLAVNASIEASKAGEQGKGFAVVAHEVKSLAAQSKDSTVQIRTILHEIQKAVNAVVLATEQGSKAVEKGVSLSSEMGKSLRLLSESIQESAQAATQIMSSSEQQFTSLDQVAIAMQHINQASSQNAASTKQTELATHDLHSLGEKLKLLTREYAV